MGDEKQVDLFNYEDGKPLIENMAKHNGILFWHASEFLEALGYSDYTPTAKPIQKAMQVLISLSVDTSEHIKEENRMLGGKPVKDFRLSRFACYLVSMNADPKKSQVAKAQAYFAALADFFQEYVHNHEDIERVILREEVSNHEKTLHKAASGAGLENYAYFQSKGYLGLYNMILPNLKARKGIPSNRTPLDFMNAEELGANIFRITQTEAKIRRENVQGQKKLEDTAFNVGKEVRQSIQRIGGTMPENLPRAEDIAKIKTGLKRANRGFIKSDNPKKIAGKNQSTEE